MTDLSGRPFVVARVGKAHGLKGEVTVQVHTDDPDRRLVPDAVFVTEPAGAGPLVLRTVRLHQGTFLLGFEGCHDRNAAQALRGTLLLLDHSEQDDDEPDAWRAEELVGFVVELTDGTVVGEVSGLHPRAAQDLLEVRLTEGGTALVPFVEEMVPEVDESTRRVVIDPPEGLLELGG